MQVYPAPGLKVRDPHTRRHVPAEGLSVTDSPVWRQLVNMGDLVLTPPAPPVAKITPPDSTLAAS